LRAKQKVVKGFTDPEGIEGLLIHGVGWASDARS